jgi:hypothetical protein
VRVCDWQLSACRWQRLSEGAKRDSPVPCTSLFCVSICESDTASTRALEATWRSQVYRPTECAVLTTRSIIQAYRMCCIDGTQHYTGLQNVLYWRHTTLYRPTECAVLTAHSIIQAHRMCCVDGIQHYTCLQNVMYWRHTTLYRPTECAVLTAHNIIQAYRMCCIDGTQHYTGLQNVLYWRHTALYRPTECAVLTHTPALTQFPLQCYQLHHSILYKWHNSAASIFRCFPFVFAVQQYGVTTCLVLVTNS